jgi:hypothetical protein
MIEVICISARPYLTGEGLRTDGNLINLTIGQRYQARFERDDGASWLRVWDDFGEDYLYPPHMFDVCPQD